MNFDHIKNLQELADFIIEKMFLNDITWILAFKDDEINDFMAEAHSNLGRNIRNNCDLWVENSHLYNLFKQNYGLTHPDDMSGIILGKIFRVIHGDNSEDWVQDAVKSYQDHWKMMENLENGGGVYEFKFKGKKIIVSKAQKV